jgi:uncharacterized protein (TIGR01777 family)
MRIVVAGGTGFLGRPLAESWAEDGHDVRVLTRSLPSGQTRHDSGTGVPGITRAGWTPDGRAEGAWLAEIDGADAVVNLAGTPLDRGRWTARRKAELRDSRVLPTRSLALAIARAASPPTVFVSASGIGYYGDTGSGPVTEASPAGADFLARLCVAWEQETEAAAHRTRVVLTRSGVVFGEGGGALPRLTLPFRFFAGGRLGSGRQYLSWIHRLDWTEMVRWAVATSTVKGPLNVTAPHPVTNSEVARAIGRALRRPSLLPAPAFAIRLALGEMADMILTGQRALPQRPLALGYHFRYPEIDIAFRDLLGGNR